MISIEGANGTGLHRLSFRLARHLHKTIEILTAFPYEDTQLFYTELDAYVWGNDNYYQKIPYFKVIKDTLSHFKNA